MKINFKCTTWKRPDYILTRLSSMVGAGGHVYEQDGTYILGTGNNWWCDHTKNDDGHDEFELRYRYGHGWTEEDKEALKRGICLLLSIKEDNGY